MTNDPNARQDIPWMSARIKELEAELTAQKKTTLRLAEYIKALENAARSCETCRCLGCGEDWPQCVTCRAAGVGLYKGWTFDEKRFAPDATKLIHALWGMPGAIGVFN